MKRILLDRNILTVEKFLDAASEADLAARLESFGINNQRIDELDTLVANVKQLRLESDVQRARQKNRTAHKEQQKRILQHEITRLVNLIRSAYPKASWLSQLGLETRYHMINRPADGGEDQLIRKAVRRSTSEAEFRGRCYVLLENLDELDVEVLAFLNGRGWSRERMEAAKTLLQNFVDACENRDSHLRLSRQKNAQFAEAVIALRDHYRSYSRQVRGEAGDDPMGQKLSAAAKAWFN